jgi:hypothetical protein
MMHLANIYTLSPSPILLRNKMQPEHLGPVYQQHTPTHPCSLSLVFSPCKMMQDAACSIVAHRVQALVLQITNICSHNQLCYLYFFPTVPSVEGTVPNTHRNPQQGNPFSAAGDQMLCDFGNTSGSI